MENPFAEQEARIISKAEKKGIDVTIDGAIQAMLSLTLLGMLDKDYLDNLEEKIDGVE